MRTSQAGAAEVFQPSYFAGLAKSSMVLPNRMPVVGDTTPEPKGVLICRSAMDHTRNTNRTGGRGGAGQDIKSEQLVGSTWG